MDLLDIGTCHHSWALTAALAELQTHGRGVAVLLNAGESAGSLLDHIQGSPAVSGGSRGQMDLRTYGIGAQILRDLGVSRMKLMGSPRRMPSMTGYGLEVTGFVAVQ
jgi:3,4-dihydroxy 2-butanone 4-phosphate synthase/GTP cyclohydrolase II